MLKLPSSNYTLKNWECLQHGDHICHLYSTDEERRKVTAPYIKKGIRKNEKILYITDTSTVEEVKRWMQDEDIDVETLITRNQLAIVTSTMAYAPEGRFDPDPSLQLMRDSAIAAVKEGWSGLRGAGEMGWALRGIPGTEHLVSYEAKINQMMMTVPPFPITGMCQFNISQFQPAIVMQILMSHQYVVIEDEIYQNYYHIPPEYLVPGENFNFVCLSRWLSNIQERKRIEEQLIKAKEEAEQALKAKSQFLAIVSHEIRTPTSGMIGLTELLLATGLSPQQKEYVETIAMCGNHLTLIINDVLDFSKIESGKLDLESAPFDIRACANEARAVCSHLHPPYPFSNPSPNYDVSRVRILVEPEVPHCIEGDSTRVRQVFVNLLANALKFSSEGEILIHIEVDKQAQNTPGAVMVKASVQDHGIGIDPAYLPKLFDSFTQAETSTTRKYGGSGLGLSICKRLVQLMGGDMTVESTVGEGATFTFTFRTRPVTLELSPEIHITQKIEDLRVSQALPPTSTKSLQVLVVEDNDVNQKIIRQMVSTCGCACDVACDGQEAVEIVCTGEGNKPYDIIFMDLYMPRQDGWSAARAIRAHYATRSKTTPIDPQYKQPKIIAVTASVLENTPAIMNAFQECFDGYLLKPVRINDIKSLLQLS
jgi:signal transduction histidine kinase/AmiR/NasT family two-component response regulator